MPTTSRKKTFGYRDILLALRDVGVEAETPVLVIGPAILPESLRGGVSAILAALHSACKAVVSPAFTLQTMVFPAAGPENNGVDYAAARAISTESEFFRVRLPVSPGFGPLAEAIRRAKGALRTTHPILSFAGWNADSILEAQSLQEPFGPIDALARAGGDVVLIGADHTANIALHLAEQRAGRKQFVRWGLTPQGVVECPSFPGCTEGFGAIEPRLAGIASSLLIGSCPITRIPLRDLLHTATAWIREDPIALLCESVDCPLCDAVRKDLSREFRK